MKRAMETDAFAKENDIHGELSEVEASDFTHTIKNKQWVRTSIRPVKNKK